MFIINFFFFFEISDYCLKKIFCYFGYNIYFWVFFDFVLGSNKGCFCLSVIGSKEKKWVLE